MSEILLRDWDFRNGKIENAEGGSQNFVSSDSVIIAGTPYSVYSNQALDEARVIGLIQQWSIQQQRNVPEIFEVGSGGKYILPSRNTSAQLSIARVLYDGPNLLYTLYTAAGVDVPTDTPQDAAGFGQFLINLSSGFFNRPIGLIFIFRDSQNDPVGSFFLANAIIQSHGIQGGANEAVIGENVQIRFENIYPFAHKEGVESVPRIG